MEASAWRVPGAGDMSSGVPARPRGLGPLLPRVPSELGLLPGVGGGSSRTRVGWAVGRGLDSAQGTPSPGIQPLSPGQRSAPCPPSRLLVYTVLASGGLTGGRCLQVAIVLRPAVASA